VWSLLYGVNVTEIELGGIPTAAFSSTCAAFSILMEHVLEPEEQFGPWIAM
jgi:hypothetical protein